MAANEDGFEDWDADFLDQLIQVEELALASANPTQHKPLEPPQPLAAAVATSTSLRSCLPPPPPQPPHRPPAYYAGPGYAARNIIDVSYSPPRELSQRAPDSNGGFAAQSPSAQELEIERLKKELGRVSKQLSSLEQECVELRKERDKQELLKSVHSETESKNAKCNCSNTKALSGESPFLVKDQPSISPKCQNANPVSERASSVYKKGGRTIGIQTDEDGDFPNSNAESDGRINPALLKKLRSIWSSSHSFTSRSFIANLLQICAADFCALIGCLGLDIPLRTINSLEKNYSACMTLVSNNQSHYSTEATKISKLCSVMLKISDDMAQVKALLEVLIDLCSLENVLIVHRSLRIMHRVLDQLLSMERKQERRENVKVEGLHPGCDASYILHEKTTNSARLLDVKEQGRYGDTLLFSQVDLVHLFQAICIIAKKSTENQVELEAVLIMSTILARNGAYTGREKFGDTLVFDVVAHLLRKEAGLYLRKEAVRLLHLLLNSPKLLAKFLYGHKDGDNGAEDTESAKSSPSQLSGVILEGLADCIVQCGNSSQEINLRRTAVVVLAFLAASGMPGLEIVLFYRLSNGANFLGLILRALASEIDAEASEALPTSDISKERILFMREALILLNRLASHLAYSGKVLQVLTSSRDMASLSIDIATRLSKEIISTMTRPWKSDNTTQQIRQREVIDLARVFKKRVFAFLGENVSL